ncbi:MFS transporter [Photobacterium swingsii]|uniref:MFS transporter n=1 Tax=Photobacterium swingsii TaxID=680026 RepID=UPI00352E75B2
MINNEIKRLTKLCLLLGSSLLVMANAAIVPSLAELNHVFNDPFGVSLMMTLPAFAVVVFAPFVASIINALGEKNTILLGFGLSGLAGSSGLWIDSLNMLLVGRFMLGMSIAICMTVINDLIASYFDGEARIRFISHQAIAVNIGGIMFVVASGWLTTIHWRLPFAIYLVAIIALVLSLKGIVPVNKVKHSGLKRIHLHDYKAVFPFYLLGLFGMLSYYLIMIDLPFTLKNSLGFNSAQTGMLLGGMSLISATVAYLFKFVLAKVGEQRTLAMCFYCFMVAFCALTLVDLSWGAYVAVASTGIAFGLLLPILTHLVIMYSVEKRRTAMLSGFVMFYFIGQALSALVRDASSALSPGALYIGFAVVCAIIATLHIGVLDSMVRRKRDALKAREVEA